MKWVSHKLITGSTVFILTGSPILSIISATGSIFPDLIEGMPTEHNYNAWRKNHRQISHWYFQYLMTFLITIGIAGYNGYINITTKEIIYLLSVHSYSCILSLFIAYFSLGALMHIIQDCICGTVPGRTMDERIGMKFFKVGSIKEFAIVLLFVLALISKVRFF